MSDAAAHAAHLAIADAGLAPNLAPDLDLDAVRRVMLRSPSLNGDGEVCGTLASVLDPIATFSPVNRCVLIVKALKAAAMADDSCRAIVQESGVFRLLRAEIEARQTGLRPATHALAPVAARSTVQREGQAFN